MPKYTAYVTTVTTATVYAPTPEMAEVIMRSRWEHLRATGDPVDVIDVAVNYEGES